MPTTAQNSISYNERAEGYSESWNVKQSTVTRIVDVAFSNAAVFVQDMLGYAVGAGLTLNRFLPESHPNYSGLYATSVDMIRGEAFDDSGPSSSIDFDRVVYRVGYQSLPYVLREDGDIYDIFAPELSRYVERKRDFAVENLALPPGNAYMWAQLPQDDVMQPVPKTFPTEDWTYIWHRVPFDSIPFDTIAEIEGKVNSGRFDFGSAHGFDAPIWTLLFLGAEYERYFGPAGSFEATVTYRFAYRNNGVDPNDATYQAGWNHLYRPRNHRFELVSDDGTYSGETIYQDADFHTLFIPG